MAEGSLFGETEPLRFEVPLAERMRPASLDEYAGQRHILGRGKALRLLLEGGRVPSCILYGPPGVGKTTLVRLMAKVTGRELLEINAVSAKVETLRDLLDDAAASKASSGRSAIAFVDEIYHFNKKQQNVLLPSVEAGGLILVGTTTENPWFEINKTLLSRMVVYTLEPLRTEDICALLERALNDKERGLGRLGVAADKKLLEKIAALAGGDARQALTRLEASVSAAAMGGGSVLTEEIIAQSTGRAIQRYDRDSNDHYAVISALIKSIRGSDPDAALYWLARMLEAGDDLRFIGDDIDVAKMLGMPVSAARTGVFAYLGFAAGLAGVLAPAEMRNWWPTQGEGYLLLVFASVFIGGTSVYGGSGTVWGTVVGSIMMCTIEAGIVSSGWSGFWTRFVDGLVLLISVSFYALVSKRKRGANG